MDKLKQRLVYGAMATILVLGAAIMVPTPAASDEECECTGGYTWSAAEEDCLAGGSNCAVCICPGQPFDDR